jgi:hypothetical protein
LTARQPSIFSAPFSSAFCAAGTTQNPTHPDK